ncbi:MAG: transglycosylase domain-containing protein, partial [Anaerolineae bacterium]|nr:transglycosylase domain-containing protein [Anaerolineae bacterium]
MVTILSVFAAFWVVREAQDYSILSADLPTIEGLPQMMEPPAWHLGQPTRLLDRSGEHVVLVLENPRTRPARYLPLEEIPEIIIQAVLSAKDAAFWEHNGYSDNNRATLATRLVSTVLLGQSSGSGAATPRQNLLANQITQEYGQERVLAWFLNSANFGQLAYGIDAAAWAYFNKSAVELNLGEAAMLAAILDAPTLNPIDAPQLAIERQNHVLQAMRDQGYISPEEAKKANSRP